MSPDAVIPCGGYDSDEDEQVSVPPVSFQSSGPADWDLYLVSLQKHCLDTWYYPDR